MLLIIGWIVVTVSVFGGFMYSGGNPASLIVVGEYIVIGGVMVGYLLGAAPKPVFVALVHKVLQCLKGSPYTREAYLDAISALYELLVLAREQGIVGIEDHVLNPKASAIFTKYPRFLHNHHAVSFMQDALRPIIDGKVKADQLKQTLMDDIDRIHVHSNAPVVVLGKVSGALPGVGIVAAVLGIIITMGSIAGDKQTIGKNVAAALVGTFLGLLISYGYLEPLGQNIEFLNHDEESYFEVMALMIVSYASGSPPVVAAEAGRRAIPADRQPTSEELEEHLKKLIRK